MMRMAEGSAPVLQPPIAGRRAVGASFGVAGLMRRLYVLSSTTLPILAVASDLDDAHPMRRHLDIDQLGRHLLEAGRVLTLLDAGNISSSLVYS